MFLFFPPLLLIFHLTYTVIWRPWLGPPECFHSAVWSPASHFICVCLSQYRFSAVHLIPPPARLESVRLLAWRESRLLEGQAATINAPYMWNKMVIAVCSPEPCTVFLSLFSRKLYFLDSCFSESVFGLFTWPESMFSVILQSHNPQLRPALSLIYNFAVNLCDYLLPVCHLRHRMGNLLGFLTAGWAR